MRIPQLKEISPFLFTKTAKNAMEQMWEEGPAARFWKRLLNQNVDKLINDPEKFLLKHMRYDNKMFRDYQKRFGSILEERGLCLYKLVGQAYGEVWDSEDEAKTEDKKKVSSNQRNHGNHDDLDPTRESGLRKRQGQGHVVQSCTPGSREDLEEGGGKQKSSIKEV